MTDNPLKKLEDAMAAPPAPRRKSAAAEAAMRAFDEEFSEISQGTENAPRPTSQTTKLRSWIMTALSFGSKALRPLRPALYAGTSLAAMSLVIFAVFEAGESVQPTETLDLATNEQIRMKMSTGGSLKVRRPAQPEADFANTTAQPRVSQPLVMAERAQPAPAAQSRALQAPSGGLAATSWAVTDDIARPAPENRDQFANADANPVKLVAEEPVSTFSIDVDTASMSIVRRSIMAGALPPKEAVRTEELINYFPYNYPAPTGDTPFRTTATVMDAPWAEGRKLVHIGIRGALPAAPVQSNFTFLIDTSGSMRAQDKLPLLIASLRLLLNDLGPDDSIAIVTYAGAAGTVLEPTKVADRAKILSALDKLAAGGGTAGAAGLTQAYRLATENFDETATNRVILATDGDFNIGASSPEALEDLIADQRESGVYLSVLGFGRGNLNDNLMQTLAQTGNGQAAYIDTLAEARKVLVEERSALHPIANDVKIQVEFNPAAVSDYRLIGYETRALAREDFNNDKVDAGEIGAGHRVTAIYEVTPVGGPVRIDDLRYQPATTGGDATELGFLRLRYKAPGETTSQLIETPIANETTPAGAETQFAVAMAGFGEILRGSQHLGGWDWDKAISLATGAKGEDRFGYRAEAVELMRLADAIDQN